MKLSDRILKLSKIEITEIRIPLTRKNLALMAISVWIYSMVLIIIYDSFFRIKMIKLNPNGTIEYRVK
jgi:hypothetical protein